MTHDLVREILVDAEPETIWPFLIDPARHVEWCGTAAELDPRPGGTYRVLIYGEHQSEGTYLEVVPNEKVRFSFGWDVPGNPITPGSTEVEISLHPEGTKTLVRLTHRGLPDEQAVTDHTGGWDRYLDRLSVVSLGGTVGPDVASADEAQAG